MWQVGRVLALALLGLHCGPATPVGSASRPAMPATRSTSQGPGPAVGESFPAFEAFDQEGRRQTFESLRGPNGLLLNINRSVVW